MRIHKEERKYLCPDCGYKCKWVNQLKYHMTKHTGECCPPGTGCGSSERVLGLWGPQLRASFATDGPGGGRGGPPAAGRQHVLMCGWAGYGAPVWEGRWGGADPRHCVVLWEWGVLGCLLTR